MKSKVQIVIFSLILFALSCEETETCRMFNFGLREYDKHVEGSGGLVESDPFGLRRKEQKKPEGMIGKFLKLVCQEKKCVQVEDKETQVVHPVVVTAKPIEEFLGFRLNVSEDTLPQEVGKGCKTLKFYSEVPALSGFKRCASRNFSHSITLPKSFGTYRSRIIAVLNKEGKVIALSVNLLCPKYSVCRDLFYKLKVEGQKQFAEPAPLSCGEPTVRLPVLLVSWYDRQGGSLTIETVLGAISGATSLSIHIDNGELAKAAKK